MVSRQPSSVEEGEPGKRHMPLTPLLLPPLSNQLTPTGETFAAATIKLYVNGGPGNNCRWQLVKIKLSSKIFEWE